MRAQNTTDAILRLYQEGKSIPSIAQELGITYQRAYNALRRAGLLKPKRKEDFSEEYTKFIAGLNIRTVQLREVHAKLERNPTGKLRFSLDQGSLEAFGPEKEQEGFWAGLALKLDFRDEMGPFGFISLKVAVLYGSPILPNEEVFQAFKERNLPVNIWPYLRLYVDFVTGQMGLPRLILPAFRA